MADGLNSPRNLIQLDFYDQKEGWKILMEPRGFLMHIISLSFLAYYSC